MRSVGLVLIAAALVGGCKRVAEGDEGGAASALPAMEVDYAVPGNRGAQVVHVLTRDIQAGAEIPWHTHPGVEIGYVVSGKMELRLSAQDPLRLGQGDSFTAPPGMVHGGRNVGNGPARIVVTYVVDAGVPLRMPADPPQ